MVRGLLWLLLWLLCGLPLSVLADEARLWLELEQTSVELGQPLHGVLHAHGTGRAPDSEQLQPLSREFAVQSGVMETAPADSESDVTHYRLDFTLYPRRSGTFTIPALVLADSRSEALTVEVSQALSQGEALRVTPAISTTRPWVREQVLVSLEVITPDPLASLEIEAPLLPGFEVLPLSSERERIDTAQGERTRLRSGLALFSLTPGSHVPSLPLVNYRLDGGTRKRFPLPALELEVRPLPPYVPPTLPVGAVSIESYLEPRGLLAPRQLGFWHIALRAEAVPPHWLPPLQPLLGSTDDVRLLPPRRESSIAADSSGIHARFDYRVPFHPRSDGRVALPELALDYFDPQSGRLERAVHRPPRPLSLGMAARLLLAALLLGVLLWSVPRLWRRGVALWRCHRERRAALTALSHAEDTAAIRAALRRYAAADGSSGNITLMHWWQRHGGSLTAETMGDLAAASYGGRRDVDLQALRKMLLSHRLR